MCKIASYNCQQSNGRATDFLSDDKMENLGLDVSCTQESGTKSSLGQQLRETPNLASSEAYVNDPCLVVSRTSERPQETQVIPITAGSNKNRSALLVRLRSGLIVVNVHLTSRNPKRAKKELAMILAYLEEHFKGQPFIIIGDFNFDPREVCAGMHVVSGPQHSGGSSLDWAVGDHIKGIEVEKLPRYGGSDHGPWTVDVEL